VVLFIARVNVGSRRDQELNHGQITIPRRRVQCRAARPDAGARIRIGASIQQPLHEPVMAEIDSTHEHVFGSGDIRSRFDDRCQLVLVAKACILLWLGLEPPLQQVNDIIEESS